MQDTDMRDLDRKLSLILRHLEYIEKHLNLPPLEASGPKRTANKLGPENVKTF